VDNQNRDDQQNPAKPGGQQQPNQPGSNPNQPNRDVEKGREPQQGGGSQQGGQNR